MLVVGGKIRHTSPTTNSQLLFYKTSAAKSASLERSPRRNVT